jgi:TRAP-type uncharacterized transport system fused permease subunit
MSSERISSRKNLIISAFAVSLTAFQIYTAAFGVFPNLIQRGIFLGFVLVLCFFVHPFRKKRPEGYQWLDFLLIVLSIVVAVYLVYHYDRIVQDPAGATWIDRGFGAILIVIVIEAARRVMGWNFPVLAILALSYALFGHYIPGNWGHRGFSYTYVLEHLFMTTQGIWGMNMGDRNRYWSHHCCHLCSLRGSAPSNGGRGGVHEHWNLSLRAGHRRGC